MTGKIQRQGRLKRLSVAAHSMKIEKVYTYVKFMFSKKATKFDEIFIFDLTLCNKFQIEGEDLVNFCGLLRKHELYYTSCRKRWERNSFSIFYFRY